MAVEYSVGPNKTELELAHEQYLQEFGKTAGTELLLRAAEADDSYGKKKLNAKQKSKRLSEAVTWARRDSHIDDDEIDRLRGVVGTVSESSFESGYSLSTMVLGAATGRSQIVTRVNAAVTAASAALAFEKWEAARGAFADCVESLRLLRRFFAGDEIQIQSMESQILQQWTRLRTKLDGAEHLLDLEAGAEANVLLERVAWNTDFGPGNGGFIPQTDAMARLVIRLEHWFEAQNGDATSLAASWRDAIPSKLTIPKEDDDGPGRNRCTVTCADALLETGNYAAALHLYDGALGVAEYAEGPLSAHTRINKALALYGLGQKEESVRTLDEIDRASLKSLSDLILTMQAEWARYLAVSNLLGPTDPRTNETATEVRRLVGHVGGLLVGSDNGRTGYLRSLFVGQLARDTEAILAMN